MKILISIALGGLLALILPGCGGGGAKNYNITRNTTIGRELTDLKDAYEGGSLTKEEYDEAKEKILHREN